MQHLVRRRLGVVTLVVACAGCFVAAHSASATTTAADAVPAKFASGIQNPNPWAGVNSISCASAGNCTAVGYFTDANGNYQAFAQTEAGGTWATAQPASFATGIQSSNPSAAFNSVSCTSAGNCTAAGSFQDLYGNNQAFTQTETGGIWETAQPATFATYIQNASPYAGFSSVSCGAPGDCTAAGYFTDALGNQQAFTQTQTGGVWGTSKPATFAGGVQNTNPNAEFNAISCTSSGNCTAAGYFTDAKGNQQAFTQTETGGTWQTAQPATYATYIQNSAPNDKFNAISCTSSGNCTAAGYFKDAGGNYEAFTQTESNGIWETAQPASFGANVQNASPNAYFESVSCTAAGDCTAAGYFKDAGGSNQAFTQTVRSGIWESAQPVSFGANVQYATPDSEFASVSCGAMGDCTAAGYFKDASGNNQAFTQTETNGIWETAQPASFGANVQNSVPADGFSAVSCGAAGDCTAGGQFKDSNGNYQAMTELVTTPSASITVTSTEPKPGIVQKSPYTPTATSTSGDIVEITIASTSSSVCQLNSGVVTFQKAGTCTVLFNDPGNSGYMPATQRSQGIHVIDRPSAPRHPRSVARNHAALVKWRKPASTGGAKITRYIVTSFPGHRHCRTRGKRHCVIHHLRNRKKYRFKIEARNKAGVGPYSHYTNRIKPHA